MRLVPSIISAVVALVKKAPGGAKNGARKSDNTREVQLHDKPSEEPPPEVAAKAVKTGALGFFCRAMEAFRPAFSRGATYHWFCIFIVGLMVRQDHLGVGSIVRWLDLRPRCYERLLHFFHSAAWSLPTFLRHWWSWLSTTGQFVEVNGRNVLLGDHTKQVKDGRCMPGVRTLHQDSETSSKPSFFRGHHLGFIAVLVGTATDLFATPLWGQIHQGRADRGEQTPHDNKDSPMTARLVQMAFDAATHLGRPVYLVLDAFFANATSFRFTEAASFVATRAPLLHIVTRMKKNAVAFELPEIPTKRTRGRPRKYGRKVHLSRLFDTAAHQFTSASCLLYGKQETVRYLCLNLLWRPVGAQLRFVLVESPRGRIILASSDLALDPLPMLQLYCARARIETMFSAFKHVIGGLAYRFWSKWIERQSRRPVRNSSCDGRVPAPHAQPHIQMTWDAIERFVNLCAVAQGILQLLSLNPRNLCSSSLLWLRTRSRISPSEFLTRHLLARLLLQNIASSSPHAILREMANHRRSPCDCADRRARTARENL